MMTYQVKMIIKYMSEQSDQKNAWVLHNGKSGAWYNML